MENNFLQFVDIISIEEDGMKNVVDISVDIDESFTLSNGIISHNSAITGLSAVRDPAIHGGFPLKGKVLNVNGLNPKDVAQNKVLQDLMSATGLIIGQKAKIEDLRYGKIWVATDMDEDGKNIAALVINFFYTFWPELFQDQENPFLNIFQTPFVIAEKSGKKNYWYAHDYNTFDPEKWKGWSITRAKGLGTLVKEDWKYSIDNPVLEPIYDDGNLKDSLDLIFNGSKADDRKEWMGI